MIKCMKENQLISGVCRCIRSIKRTLLQRLLKIHLRCLHSSAYICGPYSDPVFWRLVLIFSGVTGINIIYTHRCSCSVGRITVCYCVMNRKCAFYTWSRIRRDRIKWWFNYSWRLSLPSPPAPHPPHSVHLQPGCTWLTVIQIKIYDVRLWII